jgi:hypothetical protein
LHEVNWDVVREIAEAQVRARDLEAARGTLNKYSHDYGAHASVSELREVSSIRARIDGLATAVEWINSLDPGRQGFALLGAAEGLLGAQDN